MSTEQQFSETAEEIPPSLLTVEQIPKALIIAYGDHKKFNAVAEAFHQQTLERCLTALRLRRERFLTAHIFEDGCKAIASVLGKEEYYQLPEFRLFLLSLNNINVAMDIACQRGRNLMPAIYAKILVRLFRNSALLPSEYCSPICLGINNNLIRKAVTLDTQELKLREQERDLLERIASEFHAGNIGERSWENNYKLLLPQYGRRA